MSFNSCAIFFLLYIYEIIKLILKTHAVRDPNLVEVSLSKHIEPFFYNLEKMQLFCCKTPAKKIIFVYNVERAEK